MIPSDPPDAPETNASPANHLANDIKEQLGVLEGERQPLRGRREPILGRREGESKLDAYDRISGLPIFMFGTFILMGMILKFGSKFDTSEGDTIFLIGWLGFVIDLILRWVFDDERRTFLRRHWLLTLAVVLPPLRLVLIGYVVVRLARSPAQLRNRLSLYSLYLTILVITFGAVTVLAFEKQNPQANIKNYGQALWWALCTIATVGYGDYTPVTTGGRISATIVILTGVATISIVTATVASRFVNGPTNAVATEETEVSMGDIESRLARIETALAALAATSTMNPIATKSGDFAEENERDGS
ncbi:MAG: ion channel [Actinomycetes bacterium]